SVRRALFNEPAKSPADAKRPSFFHRGRPSPPWQRDFRLHATRPRPALIAQWTDIALWIARQTNRRTQFHHGRVKIPNPSVRQDFFRTFPKSPQNLPIARITLDSIKSAKHARHISIDDRRALIESNGRHRPGCVPP